MAWTVIAAKIDGQEHGFQDVNEIVQNILAIVSSRGIGPPIGGSRQFGVYSATYVDVPEYVDFEIDGTLLGGLTVRALVEVRTANIATAVTPKVRNVTAASDAVVGTAHSATTSWAAQTLTFTPVTGVNKYRVQVTGSNATHEVFCKGISVQMYATA